MSRKLIRPITMEEFRGVLIDSIHWKGKKVYRIFEAFDEKTAEMRFYHVVYENGRYIDVDDLSEEEDQEEIETLYKDLDINPRLYDIPKEQLEAIRREQIENFLWLNSTNLKEKLPIGKIIKLIKKVPVKYFKNNDSRSDDFLMQGYYDQEENLIAFNEREVSKNNMSVRASRFHEFIHYIQFNLRNQEKEEIDDIMSEAQTESLAIRRIFPPFSRAIEYNTTRKPALALFNYPVDSYKYAVCLLRQMETVMGRKSYDEEFASTREFPQKFIEKYGKDLYTYIVVRMNALEYEKNDEITQNKVYYLSETQDKLMKETFRQDFDRMKTIEDAKNILTRLRELELQRADLYIKEDNGEIKSLGEYGSYYNRLYQRIGQKLFKLGYSQEEIIAELEQFQYEEQEFYPIYPEETFIKDLKRSVKATLLDCFENDEGKVFNPMHQKIVYLLNPNGDRLVGISNKNNGKLVYLKAYKGTISRFDLPEDESPFTKEDIEFLESSDAPEFKLPKKLYEKYKRMHTVRNGNNFFSEDDPR